MEIRFNGEKKEFKKGVSVGDMAYSISNRLGNIAIGAKVDGKAVSLSERIYDDSEIEIITIDSRERFHLATGIIIMKICISLRWMKQSLL